MQQRNTQEKSLNKVRLHWYRYIARGGINKPISSVGGLENGGLIQWALFLRVGREYVRSYPNQRHTLQEFLPEGMIKLLTGE